MILRSIGVRHGRRALSTPIARASFRRITTAKGRKATNLKDSDPQMLLNLRERVKRSIRPVGSVVQKRYEQDELIANPLQPSEITLERLMAAQTHMGHHASLWNPANSRYIYGVRQGIHIISLETTAAHLRRAAKVVEEVSYRGGLVLFAGTRKGQMEIVTEAAKEAKACHLFSKWTPGSITNKNLILGSRAVNIVNERDEVLPGFESFRGEVQPLVPDLVVCFNPLENYTLLYECGLAGVPTIGVIDSDADPTWVTYTIPANDDSLRSIGLIASVLGQAGKQGQKRRLSEAEDGNVTWQTPKDIISFIDGMTARRNEVISSILDQRIISGGLREADDQPNGPPEGHPGPPPDALAQGQQEAAAVGSDAGVGLSEEKATAIAEESVEGDLEKKSQDIFKELTEGESEEVFRKPSQKETEEMFRELSEAENEEGMKKPSEKDLSEQPEEDLSKLGLSDFQELAESSIDEMSAMESEIEKEVLAMLKKQKAEVTEEAIMSGVGVEKGVPEGQADAAPVEKQVETALARAEAEASIVQEHLEKAAAAASQVEAKTQQESAPKEAQAEAGAVSQDVMDALAKAQAQVKLLEEQLKRSKGE